MDPPWHQRGAESTPEKAKANEVGLAAEGPNPVSSALWNVPIGAKPRCFKAPDTDGIQRKGRLYFLYAPIHRTGEEVVVTPIRLLQGHRLLPALFLQATLLGVPAPAQSSDCDCSCESFNAMSTAMEKLRERAQSGEQMMPPRELQEMAACAGECAMAWSQCDSPEQGRQSSASRERDSADDSTPDSTSKRNAKKEQPFVLGEPRDDLARFYGIYASADQPGRDFFVTKAKRNPGAKPIPPGYLMVGAMWGDVAPWYMKSVGDLRFEQQWTNPGAEPLVVEFESDEKGNAVSLQFLSGFLADRGRLEREGDLPEGW